MTVFLNSVDPYHLIFAGTGPQAIANRDFVNTVILGPNEGALDRGNPEVSIIDPLGTVPVTGDTDLWAIVDDNDQVQSQPLTAEVDTVKSAQGWSPAPSQIAAVISPLAAAIATQIAQTGIPLIANPQTMYNISAPSSGGQGTGIMGVSVIPATGQTMQQAIAAWNTATSIPVQSTKVYNSELSTGTNTWATTVTPNGTPTVQAAINFAQQTPPVLMRCCLCYSPSPNTTPQIKANLAASLSAMKSALVAAGAPAPVVCLWQEPQVTRNGLTPATYVALVQYYANTDANGTGVRSLASLFYDGEGFHTDLAAAFYPGSAFIDGIAVDYYADDFLANKSLDTWHQLDTTKPFGVWEMGNSAAGKTYTHTQITNYLTGTNQPVPSVQQELVSIIQAGGTVDAAMWYQNDKNTTGVNLITTSTDYRVPLLQAIASSIGGGSATPSPGLAIAAGATTTLVPSTPSPGGGYAPATGISYDIVINPVAGASSTIPFFQVQLFWHNVDTPGSLSITRQTFFIPLGATGTSGTIIQGQGPQAGILCAVKVKNLDTVTGFLNFQMASVSRQQAAHRWLWNSGSSVAVPSFVDPNGTAVTIANGSLDAKVMAVLSPNITAGAKKSFLAGLWTGNAWIRIANAGTFDVVLQEPFGDQVVIWHGDSSSTAELNALLPCPRSPVVIEITNNGATGSINVDMIMQDP